MGGNRQGAAGLERRKRLTAAAAGGLAVAMVGLAYASVPLYRLFCQVTGFDGTPLRAAAAPATANERTIEVRFDANIGNGLAWEFRPERVSMRVRLGEETLAVYRVRNLTDHALTGTAIFNVSPPQAGAYFNKIECFCFTEQTLHAGASAELPVSFFVDPAIAADKDLAKLSAITLSYTFYPVAKPSRTSAIADDRQASASAN
jgi:cytochrome c oxidase assembly protein subunit 11